jgi:hypothetical protein
VAALSAHEDEHRDGVAAAYRGIEAGVHLE